MAARLTAPVLEGPLLLSPPEPNQAPSLECRAAGWGLGDDRPATCWRVTQLSRLRMRGSEEAATSFSDSICKATRRHMRDPTRAAGLKQFGLGAPTGGSCKFCMAACYA